MKTANSLHLIVTHAHERAESAHAARRNRFQRLILPHFDAARKLARWLIRNDQDAEDVVQEAYLRAFQFFGSFHGSDGRKWLLGIVRNTCYTFLQKSHHIFQIVSFDESERALVSPSLDPESALARSEEIILLRDCLAKLPPECAQVMMLRELDGFSYRKIAQRLGIPIGTVMSRLARGRLRMRQLLSERSIVLS